MMAFEQVTPEDGGDDRREQKLRIVAQRRGFELAALDAAVDQARHGLDAARDHLLVIEGGELRMLVPFRNEKPGDEGALGADQLLDEGEERPLEKGLDRQLGLLHPL